MQRDLVGSVTFDNIGINYGPVKGPKHLVCLSNKYYTTPHY